MADWQYIIGRGGNSLEKIVPQYGELNKINCKASTQDEGRIYIGSEHCRVKTLDGLCGVMVIHRTAFDPPEIPKWEKLLQYIARNGDYTQMMVTNIRGLKLRAWKLVGFKSIDAFNNLRTGNDVEILIKDVEYPE